MFYAEEDIKFVYGGKKFSFKEGEALKTKEYMKNFEPKALAAWAEFKGFKVSEKVPESEKPKPKVLKKGERFLSDAIFKRSSVKKSFHKK